MVDEIRHVVQGLYMGLGARKPDFVACEKKGTDQPAHRRSLFSAFVIRPLGYTTA